MDETQKPHSGWTPERLARYSATMDRKRVDLIARKQREIEEMRALATDDSRFVNPPPQEGPTCMRGHSLAPPNGVPKYNRAGALVQTLCKACNALRARFRDHGLKAPRPQKNICKYGHALTSENLVVFPPIGKRSKERRLCKLCYERRIWENNHKPGRYIPHPKKLLTLRERLEKFTRKTADHWYWTGRNEALTFEGKRRTMRRWWHQAVNGEALTDRSQIILMACGDARCINPAHYKVVATRDEMRSRSHHMHEAVAAMSAEEKQDFHRRRTAARLEKYAGSEREKAPEGTAHLSGVSIDKSA